MGDGLDAGEAGRLHKGATRHRRLAFARISPRRRTSGIREASPCQYCPLATHGTSVSNLNPMGNGTTHFNTAPIAFRNPAFRYTATGRHVGADISVAAYLQAFFPYIDRTQVESLFAFVDTHAPLYGGRIYWSENSLNASHLAEMNAMGIHLSLPMTNHYFDPAAYKASLPVLAAHHRKGNSVIMVDDEFARQVRQDFPLYMRKASVIKKLLSPAAFARAFDLYDIVVLPMERNDDFELLRDLEPKDRIQIFANASCAYTCPAKVCYRSVSRINRGELAPSGFRCSQTDVYREQFGTVFFDIDRYADLGYRNFKLVPVQPAIKAAQAIARQLTRRMQPVMAGA